MADSMPSEPASPLKRRLEGQQGTSLPTADPAAIKAEEVVPNGSIERPMEPASKRIKLEEEEGKVEKPDRREKVHGIALVKPE